MPWDSDWLVLSHVHAPDLGSESAPFEPWELRMGDSRLAKGELMCCSQKPEQAETSGDD